MASATVMSNKRCVSLVGRPGRAHNEQQEQPSLVFLRKIDGVGRSCQRLGCEIRGEEHATEPSARVDTTAHAGSDREHRHRRTTKDFLRNRAQEQLIRTRAAVRSQNNQVHIVIFDRSLHRRPDLNSSFHQSLVLQAGQSRLYLLHFRLRIFLRGFDRSRAVSPGWHRDG